MAKWHIYKFQVKTSLKIFLDCCNMIKDNMSKSMFTLNHASKTYDHYYNNTVTILGKQTPLKWGSLFLNGLYLTLCNSHNTSSLLCSQETRTLIFELSKDVHTFSNKTPNYWVHVASPDGLCDSSMCHLLLVLEKLVNIHSFSFSTLNVPIILRLICLKVFL